MVPQKNKQVMKYTEKIKKLNNTFGYIEYLIINTPTQGNQFFKLKDHQAIIIQDFFDAKKLCVKSSRQLGMTTTMLAIANSYMMGLPLQSNKNILFVSDRRQTLDHCKKVFLNFRGDEDGMFTVKGNTLHERFSNSKISFEVLNNRNLKGFPKVDMLFVDNAAFIPNRMVEDMFRLVTDDSYVFINSTPKILRNNETNWFHDLYCESNKYARICFPWYVDDTRDERWLKQHSQGMPINHVKSEFYADFVYED
jgi:hypothetical protein